MSDELHDTALIAIEQACTRAEKIPPGGILAPWECADFLLLGALLEIAGVRAEWEARRQRLMAEILSR